MQAKYVFVLIACVTALFAGCMHVPIDLYMVPIQKKDVVVVTPEKLAEIKAGFHRLCKANGLRQSDESGPASDQHEGIWFIYMNPHPASAKESLVVFFERAREGILIQLHAVDGSSPESKVLQEFRGELLEMLRKIAGPDNVEHRRDFSSGISLYENHGNSEPNESVQTTAMTPPPSAPRGARLSDF